MLATLGLVCITPRKQKSGFPLPRQHFPIGIGRTHIATLKWKVSLNCRDFQLKGCTKHILFAWSGTRHSISAERAPYYHRYAIIQIPTNTFAVFLQSSGNLAKKPSKKVLQAQRNKDSQASIMDATQRPLRDVALMILELHSYRISRNSYKWGFY